MVERTRNMAGPVLRGGDVAQAVIEAAEVDNPDKEVSMQCLIRSLLLSSCFSQL